MYWNSSFFLNEIKQKGWFVNINAEKITNYNQEVYANDIFPYYNFVVLQTKDYFLINALRHSRQFKLIDNINGNVQIYKNTCVNLNLQHKFISLNDKTF